MCRNEEIVYRPWKWLRESPAALKEAPFSLPFLYPPTPHF
jgi:hypothetical protein